ncbi:hypothetical protein BDU57DRAFT_273169 [Ampelomyces quisqualis]|uniref:Uncharacterized protein n=1 Tax=Ampelomyces quisqualis TaxID=50730 RepID=A0A6A5QI16_AMPQU|nr:hypothetical protein BDU57DRAFT_273169 [Ampelomyces quisqualis]
MGCRRVIYSHVDACQTRTTHVKRVLPARHACRYHEPWRWGSTREDSRSRFGNCALRLFVCLHCGSTKSLREVEMVKRLVVLFCGFDGFELHVHMRSCVELIITLHLQLGLLVLSFLRVSCLGQLPLSHLMCSDKYARRMLLHVATPAVCLQQPQEKLNNNKGRWHPKCINVKRREGGTFKNAELV